MVGKAGKKPWKDTPRDRANPAAHPCCDHARAHGSDWSQGLFTEAVPVTRPRDTPQAHGMPNTPRQLPKALPPSARVSAVQIITPLVNDWIHDSHKM
jgi:hypothetical protein